MSTNSPRPYLICYDIADARRLGRLHRFIADYAILVQYSVYICWLGPAALLELSAGIDERIDSQEDDVRIYPLPERLSFVTLGRGSKPSGVHLFEDDKLWSMISGLLAAEKTAA